MAFTNTSPCVFPTGSAEKGLGSNPICMAAPSTNGDSFFLDMASTTVAYGKVTNFLEGAFLSRGNIINNKNFDLIMFNFDLDRGS